MNSSENSFTPGFPDFSYADLYKPNKLEQLYSLFNDSVRTHDEALFSRYSNYHKTQGSNLKSEEISDILVAIGPYVGKFIATLFSVEQEREKQADSITIAFDSEFYLRKTVVNKIAKKFKNVTISDWDVEQLKETVPLIVDAIAPDNSDQEQATCIAGAELARLSAHYAAIDKGKPSNYHADISIREIRLALGVPAKTSQAINDILKINDDASLVAALLNQLERWLHIARLDPELLSATHGWLLFKSRKKTDFNNLVEFEEEQHKGYTALVGPGEKRRRRDGFVLTDKRFNAKKILDEVDHCIYCHDRNTDSCSKGMKNRKSGQFKSNPLGTGIIGCPLEEKISEMQLLKKQGDNIGALAMVMIDNPMCPGTGHRICNDCMKGCIYQKTEPVNIPQIETNVLTEVLFMPWGFEIYSFLTRWNPLNVRRPYALPYNGKNILITGLGPAGYTLAHYLVNEGFGVVGIDGLKIEPLPEELVGSDDFPPQPIRDFNTLYEDLDKRILAGFGGVAEYGITVRWDKNFLKVIYLTLARRNAFRSYGGIRFGGTLAIDDAWALGFDHIAIAVGAGRPTIIKLKNNLIRGIRKASDFLMGLQLTGAAKISSLANLQVRLPAGVIGGGLTATDTATELLAYYPVQVEKMLDRYETLLSRSDEQTLMSGFDTEEREILEEFLSHGQAIRNERDRARKAGEEPDFQALLNSWGGVTVFYRKGIRNAPAYTQNHEEIEKALEEGMAWAEGMNPVEAFADNYRHLKAVRFEKMSLQDGRWVAGDEIDVSLRNLYVAAGTSPNTVYQDEYPGTFDMDNKFFQRFEPTQKNNVTRLELSNDTAWPKIGKPAPFTSYQQNGRYISFYGDNHPVYAGNVVKAMASAKDGYPYIVELFAEEVRQLDPAGQQNRDRSLKQFQQQLDGAFLVTIKEIKRLTPNIIEITVKAPMQARRCQPGQFFRLQNYETHAPVIKGTVLACEGIALTGVWVDKENDLISLIVLEIGSSTRLCASWKPGMPVVLMGVTGTPTDIPTNQSIMLVGGGLGNAVLLAIGKAMRAAGNRVVYFAGYKYAHDVFKADHILAASDVVVWSVDPTEGAEPLPTTRAQDHSCVGSIIDSIEKYANGELGETGIALDGVTKTIVIGSDRMMAAVKEALHGRLKHYFQEHQALGSINSPMQCMMKGICSQCLCKHIDPQSGEESFVYSCFNQDQDLHTLDFPHLNARLRQNTVQEKLSGLWLDYLLSED